jgi:hypothetical protein
VADVSAIANPNTGVPVYDSYGNTEGANWYALGGTSASAPIIASAYALAGNTINYGEYPYIHTSSLNAVDSGSMGIAANSRRISARVSVAMIVRAGWGHPTGLTLSKDLRIRIYLTIGRAEAEGGGPFPCALDATDEAYRTNKWVGHGHGRVGRKPKCIGDRLEGGYIPDYTN